MSYNADNMMNFLGTDVSDREAEDFASFLESRGWELSLNSDGQYVAYRDGEEMTESEWQAELNSYSEKDTPMSNISYTVQIGEEDDHIPGIESPERATELAIRACKENPECPVYVSWFRFSDGQHGYLNRSGDHDVTGRNWQK